MWLSKRTPAEILPLMLVEVMVLNGQIEMLKWLAGTITGLVDESGDLSVRSSRSLCSDPKRLPPLEYVKATIILLSMTSFSCTHRFGVG